jgi:hypothetical protein
MGEIEETSIYAAEKLRDINFKLIEVIKQMSWTFINNIGQCFLNLSLYKHLYIVDM